MIGYSRSSCLIDRGRLGAQTCTAISDMTDYSVLACMQPVVHEPIEFGQDLNSGRFGVSFVRFCHVNTHFSHMTFMSESCTTGNPQRDPEGMSPSSDSSTSRNGQPLAPNTSSGRINHCGPGSAILAGNNTADVTKRRRTRRLPLSCGECRKKKVGTAESIIKIIRTAMILTTHLVVL